MGASSRPSRVAPLEASGCLARGFRQLGEHPSVAAVYASILQSGGQAFEALDGIADDHSQIRVALRRLLSLGLITQTPGPASDTYYHAIRPTDAFAALALELRWRAERYPPHHMEGSRADTLDAYADLSSKIYEDLARSATALHQPRTTITPQKVIVAPTREDMVTQLAARIASSTRSVLAVATPPHLLGPLVWTTIRSRIEAGVEYSRITASWELSFHGLNIVEREVSKHHVHLHLAPQELMLERFYVFDEAAVAFFSPGAAPDTFEFDGQVVLNVDLASRYVETFTRLLSSTVPAPFALTLYREAQNALLRRARLALTRDGYAWFKGLTDDGVFSAVHLAKRKEAAARAAAQAAGLVTNERGALLPEYGLSFETISAAWKARAGAETG